MTDRLLRKFPPYRAAQKRWHTWREGNPIPAKIVEYASLIICVAVLVFFLQAFVVKPYSIPSGSMEPTLSVGQRILVDRAFFSPSVGQIVVFHPHQGASPSPICGSTLQAVQPGGAACAKAIPREDTSINYIKRIVAGPGDEIYILQGHVFRKARGSSTFVQEKAPYITPCDGQPECNFPTPITIPKGHWFMMGDNRGDSDDSRFWGAVPQSWIVGAAFFTYWPLNRIGTL